MAIECRRTWKLGMEAGSMSSLAKEGFVPTLRGLSTLIMSSSAVLSARLSKARAVIALGSRSARDKGSMYPLPEVARR